MKKTELLLPAGNVEAFHAAISGGADAVYLGLPRFNARNKAANFTYNQLSSLIEEAKKNQVRVYITLNTLIKNSEIPDLLDNLYVLTQLKIDAVIIQDWGIYYLVKHYFPDLTIHASTQMSFHNSAGALLAEEKGFKRVILARELTLQELESINSRTGIELEIFIHGALCYSFSGICLFSSYLGGMSANRGQCRQPCRRLYESEEKSKYLFSLKDLQLIDLLPKFTRMGIRSLKIEGRMKSAEYVYNTARAYRLALDHPEKTDEAKKILTRDMGREKTEYFMGNYIADSITRNPFLGIEIGKVKRAGKTFFEFTTSSDLSNKNRLRLQKSSGRDSKTLIIEKLIIDGDEVNEAKCGDFVRIIQPDAKAEIGDTIILSRLNEQKFSSKLNVDKSKLKIKMPAHRKDKILSELEIKRQNSFRLLYIRINDPAWIRKLHFQEFNKLIVNFSRITNSRFDWDNKFFKSQSKRVIIQLPEFIPEAQQNYHRNFIMKSIKSGYKSFMISHISQLTYFKQLRKVEIYASESVYSLNDAAIAFLHSQGLASWISPLENDFGNLMAQKNRIGIIPLFFIPRLFYSRMPIDAKPESLIKDQTQEYQVLRRDAMTEIIPQTPVSLLHYHDKLRKKGYNEFLIDLSYLPVSKSKFKRLVNKFRFSENEQPGTIFNFKEGLT